MNKYSERGQSSPIIPLTPNLEQYKLHGKQKGKKKPAHPSIQPTIQPINYGVSQKQPTTPTNNKTYMTCLNHPDRRAIYISKQNPKKHFCALCAVTDGGGDSKFIDQQSTQTIKIEYQKTKSIQTFKKRIQTLKQSLNKKQIELLQILNSHSHNYAQHFEYLNTSFQTILQNLEQKHKQLNNTLHELIKKNKQSLVEELNVIQKIKKSIDRYIYDINCNYQQIISELSIENFRDIIQQYNTKIEYYVGNLGKFGCEESESREIGIYLPLGEIYRCIDKGSIHYGAGLGKYCDSSSISQYHHHANNNFNTNGNMGNNEKNVKNVKNMQYQQVIPEYKNQRKSQSKYTNNRRKTPNLVHTIRGANKQNYHTLYNNNVYNN